MLFMKVRVKVLSDFLAIPFLLLAGLLLTSAASLAANYHVPLDEQSWDFEQVEALRCVLTRNVQGLGEVSLVAGAGQTSSIMLQTMQMRNLRGVARFILRPAPWNRRDPGEELGVTMKDTGTGLKFDLDISPLEWMSKLTHSFWLFLEVYGSRPEPLISLEVPTTGINFQISELTDCLIGLLPYNFEQLEKTVLYFEPGKVFLSERQQLKLADIANYLQWDGTVIGLSIDAHADSSGYRLDNLKLSKQRAEVVYDYLLSKSVKPTQVLHLRHHGQRYPVADNGTRKGRQLNRRVVITLKRDVQRDFVQSALADP
ncbi:OmpA family protein [Sansalvadorimonas sp. 2012CJ34-2]|uniref:OmpA family protein n=1 Tax=Parendozoicomonas callyspongiae TaxID=2942213 RepID=A0ABT0PDT3_9GAMM|nr:OmpA family protein [Sansalvadorimonas sp. 2012CJ34-2]MCL6269539.1 OmpA family protein [Sansalvadorimonas sp. 2012CJ34-2]